LVCAAVTVCNIAIHALVMTLAIGVARAAGRKPTTYPLWRLASVMILLALVLMAAHTGEVARFGTRVRTVQMHGNEADDRARILQVAPGPIDCVLDILPPAANAMQVRTAIMAVRPYGRVVLMGGVGMLGGAGLDLPYPWMMRNCITLRGQWMYPPHAAQLMTGLIRSGLVKLDHFEITAFDLDHANAAVAHAATNGSIAVKRLAPAMSWKCMARYIRFRAPNVTGNFRRRNFYNPSSKTGPSRCA